MLLSCGLLLIKVKTHIGQKHISKKYAVDSQVLQPNVELGIEVD